MVMDQRCPPNVLGRPWRRTRHGKQPSGRRAGPVSSSQLAGNSHIEKKASKKSRASCISAARRKQGKTGLPRPRTVRAWSSCSARSVGRTRTGASHAVQSQITMSSFR
ncbi:hypothetical protein LZ31DRAFT_520799 [Colletotrichum somersetense]|nr:hypothetical protein LZ31DRAFT_520799 [Colletotrichum somersetense]